MSQSPQRLRPTSQSPARPRNVGNGNRRSFGLVNMSPGATRRLPLLAALLVLAALLLVPAVVFAATPTKVSGLSATSGDGTMKLTWNNTTNAVGGYQYRYSNNATALFDDSYACEAPNCVRSDWTEASTSKTVTNKTIAKGTLTVGTTYFFQVRGVGSGTEEYGEPSDTAIADQRAAPSVLSNLTATAGNAQVTLNWDDPNDSSIINYAYRQDDGSGFPETWINFTTNTNEYTVTGLTNGTEHRFQVRADNKQGAGPGSDIVKATPEGPPAAPDLRATPGSAEVRLFWIDLDDAKITKFQYRYRVNTAGSGWEPETNEGWADISGSSATTTEHTVTGLTNGGDGYVFEVRAISDAGNGEAGSVTATPTQGARAPSQMSNLQHTVTEVTGGSDGKVRFTWDDPSEDFIGKYEYRYDGQASNPGDGNWDQDWTQVPSSIATTTSYPTSTDGTADIPGSSPTVYFQFRAVNTNAEPDLSGPATAVTVTRTNTPVTTTPPLPVAANIAIVSGANSVTVSWDKPDATGLTWQKQENKNDADYDEWSDLSGVADCASDNTRLCWTKTGLTSEDKWTFKIRTKKTVDGAEVLGEERETETVTVGAPGAPTDLSVTQATDNADTADVDESQTTLNLSWNAPSEGTISRYEYRQRASGAVAWTEWTRAGGGSDRAYDVTGLSPGTTYVFQVRGENGTLKGQPSAEATGATAGAAYVPDVPSGVTATPTIGGVVLTWTPPVADEDNSAPDFYRYQVSTASGTYTGVAAVRIPGDGSTTSHTVIELTPGTPYYFQMQASNTAGDSAAWSTEASAMPRSPADGTWSYRLVLDPGTITPGGDAGSEVSLVATWKASAADLSEIVTLSASGAGSAGATVDAATPQLVGFGTSSSGELSADSGGNVAAPGSCVSVTGTGAITCTIELTSGSRALFAAATAAPVPHDVNARLTTGISMTAVVNGASATGDDPANADVATQSITLRQTPPQPPTGLKVTFVSSGAVNLAWDNPNNSTIDRYEYRQAKTITNGEYDFSSWRPISPSGADTVTARITGLTNGTRYHFQIRAVNLQSETEVRESGESNTVPATPNPTPSAPRNLTAEPRSRMASISWDPTSDPTVTNYQSRRSRDAGASWDDWTLSNTPGTGARWWDLTIGRTYVLELRWEGPAGPGETASVTFTPTLKGASATYNSGSDCSGNAAGAGFGDAVTLSNAEVSDDRLGTFDIISAGVNPVDSTQWWKIEYYYDDPLRISEGGQNEVRVGWFPQECFETPSNAVTESIPVTWPPVRGEWTFVANIAPNPLESGDENGAAVTFRAIYAVTGGLENLAKDDNGQVKTDALSFKITGAQPTITTNFARTDEGRVGIGDDLANIGSVGNSDPIATLGTENTPICDREIDVISGSITCTFTSLAKIFAAPNATPGRYSGTLSMSSGMGFTARANTADHADFQSAVASAADIGMFDLNLEVVPGLPDAPENLLVIPGNSRVTLEWDDPDNQNITGYEYQQTTTQPGVTLRWTATDDTVAKYQYRHIITEPGIVITWPYSLGKDKYQYRHTTTEPGITLTWENPGDDTISGYHYQQTTVLDPNNPVPDRSGTWTLIRDSTATTTGYKVTGLVLDKAYYFEVRPDRSGESGEAVTLTSQTIQGFPTRDGGWVDVPDIGDLSGSPLMASAKFTGLDGDADHYFEVRAVDDGSPEDAAIPTQTVGNFNDVMWTNVPDSGVGEANRGSYKVTGLDIREHQYFEVQPVRAVQVGETITPTATVTLTWENPGNTDITKWQYRHSADGAFAAGDTGWNDIASSDASTTYTPSADLTTANYYQIRPFTDAGLDPVTFTVAAALSATDPGNTDIEKFQYRERTDGENSWGAWTDGPASDGSTISHTIEDVDLSTPHAFEVRGVKEEGGDPVDPTRGRVDNFQDAGDWKDIAHTGPESGKLSGTVTGLDNGVTYYFRIRAETDGGVDPVPVSNTASATTVLGPPTAPTGLTATPSSTVTEVILSWDDPGDSAITGYEYRHTTTGKAELTWTAVSEATKWEYHHSVDDGENYGRWMDTGISAAEAATAITATISGVNLHLDNVFQVRPVTGSGEQAPVDTGYTISEDFTGLDWNPTDDDSVTTFSNRVSGLDLNNNTYVFEVQWVKGEDRDIPGDTVTANVTHVGSIDLTWDNPHDGTITKYQYHYTEVKQNPPGTTVMSGWQDIRDSAFMGGRGANATRYTIPDLKALVLDPSGTLVVADDFVYSVKVRAVNLDTDGTTEQLGTESSEVKANPGLPLETPTGLAAVWDFNTGKIKVTWDEKTLYASAQFEVIWDKDGIEDSAIVDPTGDALNPVAATSYDIPVGGAVGDYEVRIRARGDFGPWSEWTTYVKETARAFPEDTVTAVEVGDSLDIAALVGDPVAALMPTGVDLAYSISGGSGLFGIDAGTGQIYVANPLRAGEYTVTVTATYTEDQYPFDVVSTDSVTVTINVTSTGQWRQYAKLTDSSAIDDMYATTVAVTHYVLGGTAGDTTETVTHEVVAVGAPEDGSNDTGVVYLTVDGAAAIKLTSSTTNEKFGYSVALDGETLVVGTNSSTGTPGQVYVYTKSADPWSSSMTPAVLTDTDDSTGGHGFGRSVAISGNTIVVGAPDQGVTPEGATEETSAVGAVYVYTKAAADSWEGVDEATAKLSRRGDPVENANFGASVAVDGTAIIVGAPGENKVYFSPVITTDVTPLPNSLSGPDGSRFGASVALDGRNLIVGAPGEGPGVAYVYSGSGSSWGQPTRLTRFDAVDGEGFGASVAVSGNIIAVGRTSQSANDNAGSVKLFERSGSRWVPYVLTADDATADAKFGAAVALSGETLVAGATGGNGAAYVLRRIPVMVDSPGTQVVDFGDAGEDETFPTPDGKVTVEVPAKGRTEDYIISVDSRTNGCGGNPRPNAPAELVVTRCADVNLFDLEGGPVDPSTITGEATISIDLGFSNTKSFRVFKRSAPGTDWEEVFKCPKVQDTGECYNFGPGNTQITIGGISSFSQYAIMAQSPVRPPGAPGRLVAEAGNRSVALTWTAPSTTGGSAIIGYDYSLDGDTNWNGIPGSDGSTTSYTVTNLRNGITYQFAVRARNSAGRGARSNIVEATPRSRGRDVPPGRARGGGSATAHVPPTFDEGASTTRQIAENSPTGTRIGGPLVARDPLERRVLYTKGGPDADLFDVASQTGQIYVRRGTVLDYESGRRTYTIEVVGNTGVGGPAKIAVTIIVTNVPEPGSVVLSPDTPPEVGAEIIAALSDPDGGINGLSWQWQRSSDGRTWNDIPGATSSSYTPTGADRGMMLRVSVRYNDAAAAGISLASMATGAVPERTPVLDLPGSVTLSPEGAPEVGTAITATLTDPDGGVAGETWQWQRSADGVTWTAIDGASTASYTPVESDVGMMLRANVSYSDAVAAGVSLVGATTEAVAAMPAPDRPGSVTLSPEGTPEVGKAITATVTDPDGEVTGEIWQWQRSADGVTWTDIDGATTERYTPTEADAGRVLRANVSYNDAVATGVNAMGMNTEAVAASPAPDLETPTPTPTPPSPPVRPATPTPTPTPTLVVPPQTSTPTQTMLPTPPPTDVPPTPTAITSEVTPTEAPTTPVTPEEEGGFPAWLIIVIIIGAVIIIAGIIIIVRSRMQQ